MWSTDRCRRRNKVITKESGNHYCVYNMNNNNASYCQYYAHGLPCANGLDCRLSHGERFSMPNGNLFGIDRKAPSAFLTPPAKFMQRPAISIQNLFNGCSPNQSKAPQALKVGRIDLDTLFGRKPHGVVGSEREFNVKNKGYPDLKAQVMSRLEERATPKIHVNGYHQPPMEEGQNQQRLLAGNEKNGQHCELEDYQPLKHEKEVSSSKIEKEAIEEPVIQLDLTKCFPTRAFLEDKSGREDCPLYVVGGLCEIGEDCYFVHPPRAH